MRRGRKRKAIMVCEPNGRAIRPTIAALPPEVVSKRAVQAGVDPTRLRGSPAVVALCQDPAAGTVLGRLQWAFSPDGSRRRRLGDFGATTAAGGAILEPIITDEMELAAEVYRQLWVRWHRLTGLPRRHPQAQQFDRVDREEPPHRADCRLPGPCRCSACVTWDRLRIADRALSACDGHVLVRLVIDDVVIEDFAAPSFLLGERSAALAALRRGLLAIHGALIAGRRK